MEKIKFPALFLIEKKIQFNCKGDHYKLRKSHYGSWKLQECKTAKNGYWKPQRIIYGSWKLQEWFIVNCVNP